MMGPVLLPTGLRNSKRRLSKKYELRHRNMVADDQPCDLASQSKVWHACFKLLQVAQAFLFKRFLLSQCVLSAAWVIMPLSSDQVTALKNPETKNAFQHQNPKKVGPMHGALMKNTKSACPLERLQLQGPTGRI